MRRHSFIHSLTHSFILPPLPSIQHTVKEHLPHAGHEGSQIHQVRPCPTRGPRGWWGDHEDTGPPTLVPKGMWRGLTETLRHTLALSAEPGSAPALGRPPQQRSLRMATSVKGLGKLVPAWLALTPSPMAFGGHPLSHPESSAGFLPPPVSPDPSPSRGQLCPPVLSHCLCSTGQVSDQALLFCPGAIQGTARPRCWDSCAARRHCPGLPCS